MSVKATYATELHNISCLNTKAAYNPTDNHCHCRGCRLEISSPEDKEQTQGIGSHRKPQTARGVWNAVTTLERERELNRNDFRST